jgi:molybdopterin synthase sulfur carrier subunit
MVNVLLFGRLAEICGQHNFECDLTNTDSVCEKLQAEYPKLKHLSFAIAVNQVLITKNTALNYGDEVALMPPYSGG